MKRSRWGIAAAIFVSYLLTAATGKAANDLISDLRSVPFDLSESRNALVSTPQLLGDRFIYQPQDRYAQFYLVLPLPAGIAATTVPSAPDLKGYAIRVTLRDAAATAGAKALAEVSIGDLVANKATFLIRNADLKPGKYVASASLIDTAGKVVGNEQTFAFERSDKGIAAVPFPADGIALRLVAAPAMKNGTWATHASLPMPIGTLDSVDRLVLYEDGKPVPSQAYVRARWGPKDSSIQWAQVDFVARYKDGKPSEYRVKLADAKAPASPLTAKQTADAITVDNGFVKFVVKRKGYTGIDSLWYDASGSGKYGDAALITGSNGPYLLDGRAIRFDAKFDKNVTVEIEEQGPVRVTLVASGWYVNPEGRVDPMCLFKTRITLAAGAPTIAVNQYTTITYDTRVGQLKDLGFQLGVPTATKYAFGFDGKENGGALPQDPKAPGVFLHQDRFDHLRMVNVPLDPKAPPLKPGETPKEITGKQSDGWASVTTDDGTRVAVILKDVWQKFPKELETAKDGIAVHFWPQHGHRAFGFDEELDIHNIYKFWAFHQHGPLDLSLPGDYFDVLKPNPETFEAIPEHALNGNAQGATIANEFVIQLSKTDADLGDATDAKDLKALADVIEQNPIALPTLDWIDKTDAMGIQSAADYEHFGKTEEAFEKGFLSYTHSLQRNNEYGMWIYSDTHTYWHVDENRADLHRVWHQSHYHEVGNTWQMFFRTGSRDLLNWARPVNDRWMNIGTIAYADPKAILKFHTPGAMYHCKGCTPWGSEMYGMERRDTHAALWGHWVDPDAFIWSWYIDANARGKDMYDLWHQAIRDYGLPLKGTRREINTSLAIACTLYGATWDPNILPAIHGMGRSLREDEPLEKQNPGPLWHPLWINRYYDLTRDPKYVPFILQYARMPQIENTWTLALGALAYQISGDKTYLTQHFGAIESLPSTMYHAPGDAYDWYGNGPGPLGFKWAEMSWGQFVKALHNAGIQETRSDTVEVGTYPNNSSRPSDEVPTVMVYSLKQKDAPFTIHFFGRSFGGDLHPTQLNVYSPSGKQVFDRLVKPGGSSASYDAPIQPDGEMGIYRLELRMYEGAINQPLSDMGPEACSLPVGGRFRLTRMRGYVEPLDANTPIDVKIESDSVQIPTNFIIRDARGAIAAQGSLFKPRAAKESSVRLDPAKNPTPWMIDIMGQSAITFAGSTQSVLMSTTPEALQAIGQEVRKHPPAMRPAAAK